MPPKLALVPATPGSEATGASELPVIVIPPVKRKSTAAHPPAPPVIQAVVDDTIVPSVPTPPSAQPTLPPPLADLPPLAPADPIPVVAKKSSPRRKPSPMREPLEESSSLPPADADTGSASTTATAANDDFLTLLGDKGYYPVAKVTSGSLVIGLKVLTVYGECVMLLLDKKTWQLGLRPTADDVVWTAGPAEIEIPESAENGFVAVVDPTSAGVALEQGPNLYLLIRESMETVPQKATFVLNSATSRSILAYPVLRLTDLLQDPELAARSVHTNTLGLQTFSRRLATAGIIRALDKLKRVSAQLEKYRHAETEALQRVDATYRKLVTYYDEYEAMEQTDFTRERQAKIVSNIRVRQDATRRLLRASQLWSSTHVQAFLQDLETTLDSDLKYAVGVAAVMNEQITE